MKLPGSNTRKILGSFAILVILVSVFMFAFNVGTSHAQEGESFKIMPLGDSITKGVPDSVGYRQKLYLNLKNSGFNVDFVGSLSDGGSAIPPFDTDHEGHNGWHADQIRDNVTGWLVANPADIVLLHIGTNDISGEDQNVTEVKDILNNIDQYESDYNKSVTVIVARIILRSDNNTKKEMTTAFNDVVEAMAQNRSANGDDIIIVDMENALIYPDDLVADHIHPNSDGYEKMADVWYDALVDVLPPFAPIITSSPVDVATLGQLYTYDVNATGNPAPTYTLGTKPIGMVINPTTGLIEWTPSAGQEGFNVVMVNASNSEGWDGQSFAINVKAHIFEDGFESGDFSRWDAVVDYTNHYYNVSDAKPKEGTYHANLTKTNTENNLGYLAKILSTTRTSIYARFYWQAIQEATVPSTLFSIYSSENLHGNNLYVDIRYDGDRGWSLFGRHANGTWWQVWNETGRINENQWYCIEVYTEKGSTSNQKLWIDGVLTINTKADTSDNSNIKMMLLRGGGGHWQNEKTIMDSVIFALTYIGPEGGDITPPTYSKLSHNNTMVGQPTMFSCLWADDLSLGGFIFSTNNTGTWVNSTWTSLSGTSGWSNITETLNTTVGAVVQYMFYANDTSNNWNQTTIVSLVVTPLNYGFIDQFDDNVIDLTRWTKFQKNNGTVSETNGRLEINVQQNLNGTAGYITNMKYDLSDSDIRVDVSNEHLCEASLVITLDGLHDHFWYSNDFYVVEKHRYTNEIKIKTRVNGGNRTFLYNGTWTGPNGSLRIRIQNGYIYFYEEDTLRYSEPYRLSTYEAYVHIEANTWNPPEVGYYGIDYFDNFSLNIRPPSTPNVLSPNGGEFWSGAHNITWTTSTDSEGDLVTYEVEYSDNDGTSWQTIATGISGISYTWNTTLYNDSNNYLVRVRAYDSALFSGWNQSDNTFTVDNTLPLVEILHPTEGQVVTANIIWVNGTVSEANKGPLWPTINDTRFLLVEWDSSSFTFKNSSTIAEGPLSLTVSFSDLAGNSGSNIVSFSTAVIRTELSIFVTPSSALVGYEVKIVGRLTYQENSTGIPDAPILLFYTYHPDLLPYIPTDQSWTIISTVTTNADGSYSVTWFVMSSGYYVIEAFHPGSGNVQGVTNSTNLLITDLDNQVFSISSNSTVSAINFNSTARQLNFTVSGPSGTTGYLNMFLAQSLIPDVSELKIYFDGVEQSYEAISVDNTWFIRLTYTHSTHTVRINLGSAPTTSATAPISVSLLALLLTLITTIAITLSILKYKTKRNVHMRVHC